MAQEEQDQRISLIAAISSADHGIGKNGKLLWSIPEDMARFKALTMGHPVIMGRKTWESLPERFRPLSGRTNIVVTRNTNLDAPGAIVVGSFKEALTAAVKAPGSEEVFVLGGQQLYAEALSHAQRLYLTIVEGQAEADAFFPEYEKEFTNVVSQENHESKGIRYSFVTLER